MHNINLTMYHIQSVQRVLNCASRCNIENENCLMKENLSLSVHHKLFQHRYQLIISKLLVNITYKLISDVYYIYILIYFLHDLFYDMRYTFYIYNFKYLIVSLLDNVKLTVPNCFIFVVEV